jgi:hypothetical protein
MKGHVIIDSKGEISTSLDLDNERQNELGQVITNILQDINSYMRMNQNAMGDLKKTTIRLGGHHEVSFVVGNDQVKAVVKEIQAE